MVWLALGWVVVTAVLCGASVVAAYRLGVLAGARAVEAAVMREMRPTVEEAERTAGTGHGS